MYSKWIKYFLVVIISFSAGGYLWHHELDIIKAQLKAAIGELTNTKNELDYTKSQLDNSKVELDFINDTLIIKTAQLEKAANEKSEMLSQYSNLREQINVRLGSSSKDMQSFITPGNPSVSAKVKEITGGYSEDVDEYWMDCQRLYRWTVNNISYSCDSYIPCFPGVISGEFIWRQEYWRMPEETLNDKTGDCEDMAVLLASMIRSYNQKEYAVWLLEIASNTEEKAHLAVAFPVKGGNLTILDPAGKYYTGAEYGSIMSKSTSVAVSKWLSSWEKSMPGVAITTVFSESIYEEFSSTDEFLKWVEESD